MAADAREAEQLAALAEVGELLDRHGFEHWLFGGWAVDFHVGAVTRPHDDVDLAVWLDEAEPIAALLKEAGWRHSPAAQEDGGTGYERGHVRLELTFLVEGAGTVFVPLRTGRVVWWPGPLGEERRELGGVRARVAGLELLKDAKSTPRDDADEAAKDGADYEALSRAPH